MREVPPDKFILDACCGGRQFWFDKENPNVLFADLRFMPPKVVGTGVDARVRKCLPDIVMDFRNMDIADNTFQMVIFDPPHLFLGENSYMAQSYGRLDKRTWKDDLTKGFSECFRVLKDGGTLIFKWCECDVPLKDILKLTPYKPLIGHPSGKAQKTHWLTFIKLPVNPPTLPAGNPSDGLTRGFQASSDAQIPAGTSESPIIRETSLDAWTEINDPGPDIGPGRPISLAATRRAAIMQFIRHNPGLTAREIAQGMKFKDPNAVRPRISELEAQEDLIYTEARRCKVSGKRAYTIALTAQGRAKLGPDRLIAL